ncbi:MAG: phosphatidate cytidylyltransferase [Cellvibrionales bacterium]|nr:phosphatidate cytidylyltransferase [Porticoccaceae bacterium]|tara:strand:+ start:11181 stop:12008 length:828 start_codon:yes stop_codon:yes gene_type:complete
MLKLRIFTALAMATTFLLCLYYLSAHVFAVLLVPVLLLAGWEWSNLARLQSALSKALYLLLLFLSLAAAGSSVNFFAEINLEVGKQLMAAALGLWLLNIVFLWSYPTALTLWSKPLLLALNGLLLLIFTWLAVVLILAQSNGELLLLLGIGVVVFADVGGYFGGKIFGRRQLAPQVSPGKTWEGFACGIALQIPILMLLVLSPALAMPVGTAALLVFPVALISVFGDLFESMLKRSSGLKDSSSLLPGHGGLLDRMDGVMAGLPLFALLLLTRPL